MRLVILAAGRSERLRTPDGRPKQFVEVGGRMLVHHLLELSHALRLEPLVITRPEWTADFRAAGAEVLVEESPVSLLATLYHGRDFLREPFAWIGGDMLFTDFAPLQRLMADHLERGAFTSFFYTRKRRFKARFGLTPEPRAEISWESGLPFSIPNFLMSSPEVLSYLEREPRGNYLQWAIDTGRPLLYREYRAPVFEIDTPENLAEARLCFGS
jgi:choline kinase